MENNTEIMLQTPRLTLHKLTQNDYPALCAILQDPITMTYYEHPFSDEEVQAFLQNQLRRYRQNGFGWWAAALKPTGEIIGVCGLAWQAWLQKQVPEIGYIFRRDAWHNGYATEAATACKQYAFDTLGFNEVYSIIRDTNTASQNVAKRNGMQPRGRFTKHYWGVDMPHIVFSVRKGES